VESINVTIDEIGRLESKEEENKSMEQLFEEEDEKEVEEEYEDEENPTNQKRKFRKYLQRHLANEYRRIILQIRLLETKMQELRLEEKFVHQNKHT
jgi:hypothetical protein